MQKKDGISTVQGRRSKTLSLFFFLFFHTKKRTQNVRKHTHDRKYLAVEGRDTWQQQASQFAQLLFAVLLSPEGLGFAFRVFWLLVGHARVLRRREFQTSIMCFLTTLDAGRSNFVYCYL